MYSQNLQTKLKILFLIPYLLYLIECKDYIVTPAPHAIEPGATCYYANAEHKLDLTQT